MRRICRERIHTSTTAERGLVLTQSCLSRQVFYGTRRLADRASFTGSSMPKLAAEIPSGDSTSNRSIRVCAAVPIVLFVVSICNKTGVAQRIKLADWQIVKDRLGDQSGHQGRAGNSLPRDSERRTRGSDGQGKSLLLVEKGISPCRLLLTVEQKSKNKRFIAQGARPSDSRSGSGISYRLFCPIFMLVNCQRF